MLEQKMKTFSSILLISLILIFGGCSRFQKQQNPNVLIILADDMGWGDIGYNNPGKVYTPNLDKLSEKAVTFTQHYVMPQCTPTRIACFTGRYPGRFGPTGLQATNQKVFPVGTPNLARMLKAEGYRTYICGKWHMGSDTIDGPNNHGFDESYGSLAGAVGMYDHRYRQGEYEQAWHRNHQPIPENENGVHATDLVAGEVQEIIKNEEQPFFIFATFHAPHTPLDERGDFINQPTQPDPNDSTRWLNEDEIRWFNDPDGIIQQEPDPEKRLLLAVVHHLDYAIGEIIKTLEQTGKLENTIILFSSDNGPQVNWQGSAYPDDLHLTDFNQPIPMKGSKLDVWEGGIHVPGFIYWKGKTEPKKVDEQVHIIDWFPTLANLIGHREIAGYELDGVDLSPVLFRNDTLTDRDLYWIWNPRINRWALRYGDWKIVKYGEDEPEKAEDWDLYNLAEDPKEVKNVAKIYPEKLNELHERFLVQRSKDLKSKEIAFREDHTGKKIDVLVDGQLFTTFQWPENVTKPVFYPILTSEGTEITRGFPLNPKAGERADHPHQIGMWLTYGNVNGLDFWGNGSKGLGTRNANGGVIKHLQTEKISEGSGEGSFITTESWVDTSDVELLREVTEFRFSAKKNIRIIDRKTILTAGENKVKMPDTKEGMFGIRVARQLELPANGTVVLYNEDGTTSRVKDTLNIGITGNYFSSEGISGEIVWGTRARWMHLFGNIEDEKISLVICDHPENPNYPTYWHARTYGLFAANPLGVKDFTNEKDSLNFSISPGQSVTFRYRVIVASGEYLSAENIDELSDEFALKYK